jgi:hypothetical protein
MLLNMPEDLLSWQQVMAAIVVRRDGISMERAMAHTAATLHHSAAHGPKTTPEEIERLKTWATVPKFPMHIAKDMVDYLGGLSEADAYREITRVLGGDPSKPIKDQSTWTQEDWQRYAEHMRTAHSHRTDGGYTRELYWAMARGIYSVTLAIDDHEEQDDAFMRGANTYMTRLNNVELTPEMETMREATWVQLNAPSSQGHMHALARWYEQACPLVRLSQHGYVAALAATGIPREEVMPPWRSFMIEIPEGVVPDVDGRWATRMLLHRQSYKEDILWSIYISPSGDTAAHTSYSQGLIWSDFIEQQENENDPTMPAFKYIDDRDERAILVCKRIALGVCLAMSSPDAARMTPTSRVSVPSSKKRLEKQPACRVYMLGADVKIDCRIAVREYVLNGSKSRGPLTLQFMVRGHWRNQACGPGMTSHRMKWIEPYWKGPEDAAVLVRARTLEP